MRKTDAKVLVAMAAIAALLVVGIEAMGSGHVAFANRDIDIQTTTNQYQGCVPAGGTSGITNACTATSTPGSTQTTVTLSLGGCEPTRVPGQVICDIQPLSTGCNNIGCISITCIPSTDGTANCVTNNGVQLTSCSQSTSVGFVTCTRTEPGTGNTQSGGVIGDAG